MRGLCSPTPGATPEEIRRTVSIFFKGGEPHPEAAALCVRCPVRAECEALGADEKYGVWGGVPRDDEEEETE